MFRRRTPRHDAITDESIAPADDEVEGHVERTSSTLRSTLRSCLQVLGYRASDKSPIENTQVKAYSGVTGNRDFWDDVHGDQIWDGRRIELLRCSLTEWVALQPGLYHVEGSAELRGRALAHAAYGPQLGSRNEISNPLGSIAEPATCDDAYSGAFVVLFRLPRSPFRPSWEKIDA
jgi:hypothetical protein